MEEDGIVITKTPAPKKSFRSLAGSVPNWGEFIEQVPVRSLIDTEVDYKKRYRAAIAMARRERASTLYKSVTQQAMVENVSASKSRYFTSPTSYLPR